MAKSPVQPPLEPLYTRQDAEEAIQRFKLSSTLPQMGDVIEL